MSDHPPRPREFRLGPEPPPEEEEILRQEESVLKPDIGRADIRRLNRRVNVFTLLLPLLLIVIVLLGYLDIKRRVSQTQDSGSAEVLNLSKDLESSFSSLSVKQAELAEALDKQKSVSRKARAALAAGIGKTRKSLKQLSAVVAGQQKRLAELQKMKKELRGVARKLGQLDSALKAFKKPILTAWRPSKNASAIYSSRRPAWPRLPRRPLGMPLQPARPMPKCVGILKPCRQASNAWRTPSWTAKCCAPKCRLKLCGAERN